MAEVRDHTRGYLSRARTEIERAVARSAVDVQREAKRLVGRTSGPTRTNPDAVPSAPGQPPHLRTGTLRRSIDQETFRAFGTGEFTGRVGTNLDYGKFLEFGTLRMAARPYLRPSLDAMRPKIVRRIARAMKAVK